MVAKLTPGGKPTGFTVTVRFAGNWVELDITVTHGAFTEKENEPDTPEILTI
jgi:hypothetical protein